jgi:ABC-type transporter Mla subunit MlaD
MVGWLTALLVTLIAVVTVKARSQERFDATTPSGEALLNSISEDYQRLLDAYETAFKASKTTNDEKPLREARIAIIEYQEQMRHQVNENQFYIQTFLDDYEDMNPVLDKLHKQAQVFRDQGPRVADELAASTSAPAPQVDYSGLMTRIGVLILIVGATFAFNAFA